MLEPLPQNSSGGVGRMKRSKLAILGIVIIYLLAAVIEPCDGHSCDAEVVDAR